MKKCEVEGCNNRAIYKIYRTHNGEKKWISVCEKCELKIGNDNMRQAGGRYEGEK